MEEEKVLVGDFYYEEDVMVVARNVAKTISKYDPSIGVDAKGWFEEIVEDPLYQLFYITDCLNDVLVELEKRYDNERRKDTTL